MISEHLETYADLPIVRFTDETPEGEDASGLGFPPPAEAAWHVATSHERRFADVFRRFLSTVDTTQITALLIGFWYVNPNDPECLHPVELLTESAASLPRLRSLFLGEMTYQENEISWIEQSDITPLFEAFPELERLDVRGGEDLALQPVEHEKLRVLRFESGGLPASVVRAVGGSALPNLRHLDLWLGTEYYGGDATVADLAPLLSGERFPALRHLGLEDSDIQDDVAAAVAGAPVVARLESLSLAMGTLTDRGAEALLAGQPLTHLSKLDLHHHYLSDAMMERVSAALPGVQVDLSDQRSFDDEEDLYPAVTE